MYVDTNEDNSLDSWEPRAFTDDDGRYSTSVDGVDYCADSTSDDYDFCLRSNVTLSGGIIRIEGGYDVTTGEPFDGSLSARVTIGADEVVPNTVVSPLTTLFENVTETSKRTSLLTALGITEDDLDIDFLDTSGNGTDPDSTDIDGELFAIALKVQKVVSVLAEHIEDSYEDFGEEEGLPASATSFIFDSIVEVLIESATTTTLGDLLDSEDLMEDVFETAEGEIRTAYSAAEIDLPDEIYVENGTDTTTISILVAGVTQLDEIIDTVISESLSGDFGDVLAGSRVVEIIAQKVMSEDSDVTEAIQFFTLEGYEAVRDELLVLLREDNSDLGALADADLTIMTLGTVEDTATFSALPFTELAGKQLHVYDYKLTSDTGVVRKDAAVIFYFAAGGDMQACIKWIDSPLVDGLPTDSDNTLGKLVDGTWSLITGGYSAIITLEIAGTTQESIVKVAEASDDGIVYRFDFNDEFDEWDSDSGVVSQTTVPASNEACQSVLNPVT